MEQKVTSDPNSKFANENCDEQEELDDKEESSVLKIMVEKEEDIKQTLSILKKGIAQQVATASTMNSKKETIKEPELNGLTNLLADEGVKAIIKSIAGENTKTLIEDELRGINSKISLEDKNEAFTNGIKKLQSNLKEPSNKLIRPNDPRLNLALSLLGLKKERLI